MEILKKKSLAILQALATLKEFMGNAQEGKNTQFSKAINAGVIQSFEYSIEELWKFLRLFLQEKTGVVLESNYPRDIIRAAEDVNLISKDESTALLACLSDRNKSSHAYHEYIAQKILLNIPAHYTVMKAVVDRIHVRIILPDQKGLS